MRVWVLICGVMCFQSFLDCEALAEESSFLRSVPGSDEIRETPVLRTGDLDASLIEYPEDSEKYHTTLLLRDSVFAKEPLYQWFVSNDRLRQLKQKTHFHVYSSRDAMYVSRFQGACPKTPCLIIQDRDGRVLYKRSQLPNSGEELANHIGVSLQVRSGRWDCVPCRRPQPSVPDLPDVNPPIPFDPLPDTPVPNSPSPALVRPLLNPPFPWVLCVFAGLVSAGAVVLVNVIRESRSK